MKTIQNTKQPKFKSGDKVRRTCRHSYGATIPGGIYTVQSLNVSAQDYCNLYIVGGGNCCYSENSFELVQEEPALDEKIQQDSERVEIGSRWKYGSVEYVITIVSFVSGSKPFVVMMNMTSGTRWCNAVQCESWNLSTSTISKGDFRKVCNGYVFKRLKP